MGWVALYFLIRLWVGFDAKAREEPGKQVSKQERRSARLGEKQAVAIGTGLRTLGGSCLFKSIRIAPHSAVWDYLNPDCATVKFFFASGAIFFSAKTAPCR
jgi:hypothetical protein